MECVYIHLLHQPWFPAYSIWTRAIEQGHHEACGAATESGGLRLQGTTDDRNQRDEHDHRTLESIPGVLGALQNTKDDAR